MDNLDELLIKLEKYAVKASEAQKTMFETGEELMVLEDIKQTRFCQIIELVSADNPLVKTTAEKERLARMSKDWTNFLDVLHDKREAYNKAKLVYYTSDRFFEMARTMISVKKMELNQLNQGGI